MKKTKLVVRHGDIPVYEHKGALKGELLKHNGSFPIALGEHSGHRHMLTVERPQDLEIVKLGDGYVFRLKSQGTLTHEEHKKIVIPAGTYRSGHQNEFDPFTENVQRVID